MKFYLVLVRKWKYCTVLVLRMARRIWKETKQQPETAGSGNMLGCCLVFFPFLWAILWPHPVYCKEELRRTSACLGHARFFSCKEINSQHLYPFKVHLFFFTGNTIQMQSKENIILISSENWVGIFLWIADWHASAAFIAWPPWRREFSAQLCTVVIKGQRPAAGLCLLSKLAWQLPTCPVVSHSLLLLSLLLNPH